MNAERLMALYERVAEAPDAITRLRRFILDLAVRGKLVPQDPNDEPASELLKRITKEKGRLGIKSQTIAYKQDDAAFDLPLGWAWARIEEICSKTGSGSTPRGGKEVYRPYGIPFLRSQNVHDDGLRLDDVAYIDSDTHNRMSGTRVLANDVLLNITGGSIGRCCLVSENFGEANVSQHVAIVRPTFTDMGRFLHRLILSPFFQGFVFNEQTGAGRGGLPKNRMDSIPVPLPPLAEQHRIVAKVDELMALCDRLEAARKDREAKRDRLSAASLTRLNTPDPETFTADARFTLEALPALTTRPNQIKQLRQTILNLAVRGKLVLQDPNDEPASILHSALSRTFATPARTGGRGLRTAIAKGLIDEPPFSPASGWLWVRMGELGETNIGLTYSPNDLSNNGIPVLRSNNVRDGRIVLDELVRVVQMPKPSVMVNEGDMLICARNGSRALVGKAAIIPHLPEPMAFGAFMAIFRSPINPYLHLFLTSPIFREVIDEVNTNTINQITQANLRSTLVPLPPLAEQHRIVAKVDELMALCDRLEASLTTSDQTRTRLLEATLTEALSQTANDRPENR